MSIEPRTAKYLFQKSSYLKNPLAGTFEILPICNMDCKMCYVKKTPSEVDKLGGLKSVDEWIAIAKKAQKRGMLFLLITGGEPFLYKDFKKLYTELKKLGLMISINTNGTLLDQDMVDWLAQNPPYKINMTVYGGSNETYKRLCNNERGFDQVKNAAKMLKAANIPVKLNATITPYNKDDIEDIFNFAKEFDFNVETTTYMFPPVRRDEEAVGMGDRFSAEDAAYYAFEIDKIRYSDEELKKRAENLCRIYEGEPKSSSVKCRAGKSSFWITWDGKMTPCGMMTNPYVEVDGENFDKCWDDIVQLTSEIKTSTKCSTCKKVESCSVCAAMAYAEEGDFNAMPSYICRYTSKFIDCYRNY